LDEKKSFYQDVRKIYETIANYLKKNLPLHNMLLRDLQVLGHSSRSDPSSGDQIVRVARAIPILLNDKEIDDLVNEWILYCIESIDQSWFIKDTYIDSNGNNHTGWAKSKERKKYFFDFFVDTSWYRSHISTTYTSRYK